MKPNRNMTPEELDAQLAPFFAQGEPDITPDDTESPSNEGTLNEEAGSETNAVEETVPKSRYDAAVKEMNAKQQEAAALRKRVAELEAQLQNNSTPTGNEPMEEETEIEDNFDEEKSELDDLFPEVTRYYDAKISELQGQIDELKAKTGDFESVAKDYKDYSKKRDSKFWAAIMKAHPDIMEYFPAKGDTPYDELTDKQKQYVDWFHGADQETKDMLNDLDPVVANEALSMFKASIAGIETPEEAEEPEMKPEENKEGTDVMIAVAAKPSKLEQAKREAAPSVKSSGVNQEADVPLSLEDIRKNPNSYLEKQDDYLTS